MNKGTVTSVTKVQCCLIGGPAYSTQTLVMAGHLIVVLAWFNKMQGPSQICMTPLLPYDILYILQHPV